MNQTTASLILAAATLGTIAFESGRKAVPCQDSKLMNLIPQAEKENATLAILKAWSKAWHDANLSA